MDGNTFSLQTGALHATWDLNSDDIQLTSLVDGSGRNFVSDGFGLSHAFFLDIGGQTIYSNHANIQRLDGPQLREVSADPDALRGSDRYDGYEVVVPYRYTSGGNTMDLVWVAEVRDGGNYIQQRLEAQVTQGSIDLRSMSVVDLSTANLTASGIDDGNPQIFDTLFVGQESPMAEWSSDGNSTWQQVSRTGELAAGESFTQSMVMGVAPSEDQLRRSFQAYLNRERVQPYHQNLNHNNWYGIAHSTRAPYSSDEQVAVIESYAQQLLAERGVEIDTFLLDDGWDNTNSLWGFPEDRFPNGLADVKQAAETAGAAPGIWMSPFGGYGHAVQQRIAYGTEFGYEVNETTGRFSLAGENYYAAFRGVALDMINNQGVRMFKFDGIGGGLFQTGTSPEFFAEYEALFRLISDLRETQPDIFINATVGTWHSPYWLMHVDSIWRDGQDGNFGNEYWGSSRQKEITYRDGQVYANVVQQSRFMPIGSLMTAGLILGPNMPFDHFELDLPLTTEERLKDFADDVRAMFAVGSNLQELYVDPSLMTDAGWDILAEGARWAKNHEDIMADAHWVGGDPRAGEIYGYAAWQKHEAYFALRNPRQFGAGTSLTLREILELPEAESTDFIVFDPYLRDADRVLMQVDADADVLYQLDPFEVQVFDVIPGIIGDVTGDGAVDHEDYDLYRQGIGADRGTGFGDLETFRAGDADLDGDVDAFDLGIIKDIAEDAGIDVSGWVFLPRLDGDLNGDGFVGIEDLDILLANWKTEVSFAGFSRGDINNDLVVGPADLSIVLASWGNGTPPGATVPEPSSLALIAVLLSVSRRG